MSNRKKSSAAESDEVEQLLQAAQDEMLLKLSVDSHMSRVAPDYLDPDLRRRFQALRSRPSTSQSKLQLQKKSSAVPPPQRQEKEEEGGQKEKKSKVVVADEELRGVLGDDLSARFAALKASLSSSTTTTTSANAVGIDLEKSNSEEEQDEEDEVEKVIQWAKDAARLDPSPPSDDDDDHLISDEDDSDDDDDDYSSNKKKESKNRK